MTSVSQAVTPEEISQMEKAMPTSPAVPVKAPRQLLIINRCDGFKHSSIPYWDQSLQIMAEKTGAFKVTIRSDMEAFNTETLAQFDGICLNNTTTLSFNAEQRAALMGFVKGGKGLITIHAGTDNFKDWPEASAMVGGIFTGHPWTAGGTWAVKIDDPDHPLMKPFAGKGFKISDEIYRTDAPYYDRTKQRVLMSLDFSDPTTRDARGVKPSDADTGISWIKNYGQGRCFHCGLGHNHPVAWNRPVLEHVLAGIQFALGDLECDATPIPAP